MCSVDNDTTEGAVDNTKSTVKSVIPLIQCAVQRAAHLKNWNMVALLLLWGADTDYCDSLGRNLIHYLAIIPDSSISVLLSILRKNPSLGGFRCNTLSHHKMHL